jgi:hypothetical protein
MQDRRRALVEPSRPGNVDRRRAFTDIMERLALGVIAVPLIEPPSRHDERDVRGSAPDSSKHRPPHED